MTAEVTELQVKRDQKGQRHNGGNRKPTVKPSPPVRKVLRGEIYFVNFGKGTGSEQGGERPALIVQNDVGNLHSPTTVVVPISSQLKAMHIPTHVYLGKAGSLPKESMAVVEQVRCIDKQRIGGYIGRLDPNVMIPIDQALGVLLEMTKRAVSAG